MSKERIAEAAHTSKESGHGFLSPPPHSLYLYVSLPSIPPSLPPPPLPLPPSLSFSLSRFLSLRQIHFNCDQNDESVTKEKKRFPRESTAHCKNPQGGKIFGSFNTTSRPKYAHSNSQWEIYSCFWKLQRSGFTACRPCKLCPISQNMPAPKRALDMKYTNHIL